jgi:hypothetical protein
MEKKFIIPKYVLVILWFLVFILVLLNVLPDDESTAQANQRIDIAIKLCVVNDNKQEYVEIFRKNTQTQVCGKILSEYLPLELRYSLRNLETEEYIVFSKYRKFDTHEFRVELPNSLDIGEYEFEIKAGRWQIVTLYFEVVK